MRDKRATFNREYFMTRQKSIELGFRSSRVLYRNREKAKAHKTLSRFALSKSIASGGMAPCTPLCFCTIEDNRATLRYASRLKASAVADPRALPPCLRLLAPLPELVTR